MRVQVRIDGSPDEARRLLGQPALLALHETLALLRERWLMALLSSGVMPADRQGAGAHQGRGRRRAPGRPRQTRSA